MSEHTPKFNQAFVDFDYTLYETDRLVEAMWAVYEAQGVTRDDFLETLRLAIGGRDGVPFNFNFELQLEFLAARGYHLPDTKLVTALNILLHTDYTASDAAPFLQRLRRLSGEIILLTAGNSTFQKAKIDSTRLTSYFDEIVIVADNKDAYLKNILHSVGRGLFVNDRMEQNTAVHEAFPQLFVVGRKHPRRFEESAAAGIPYFSTLTEIIAYVEQY